MRKKKIVVGIIGIILIYCFALNSEKKSKENKMNEKYNETYQDAKYWMNEKHYPTAIMEFNQLPSSYKKVSSLKKQAISNFIQVCEKDRKEEDYIIERTCFNTLKQLKLVDAYEAETGNDFDEILDLINSKAAEFRRKQWEKKHNNPPFVGMGVAEINNTSWGVPSEITEAHHLRGDIVTYTWYICKNGMQYHRYAEASRNGSVFFVSSEGNGIDVTDISPNMRKCPE